MENCQLLSMHTATATAKSLQSCPTLYDPQTAAHQAPQSLGFSRQEHWSGLPLPSPTFIINAGEPIREVKKVYILTNSGREGAVDITQN